jgi:hypothetical protein
MKKAAFALALLLTINTTFCMKKNTPHTLQRLLPDCSDVTDQDSEIASELCISGCAGAGMAAGGYPIFGGCAIAPLCVLGTFLAWGAVTIPNSIEKIQPFDLEEKLK